MIGLFALAMAANIAFLLATRIGMLSITAVVTSLYPGPTVPRACGLALALAGVAFTSA